MSSDQPGPAIPPDSRSLSHTACERCRRQKASTRYLLPYTVSLTFLADSCDAVANARRAQDAVGYPLLVFIPYHQIESSLHLAVGRRGGPNGALQLRLGLRLDHRGVGLSDCGLCPFQIPRSVSKCQLRNVHLFFTALTPLLVLALDQSTPLQT